MAFNIVELVQEPDADCAFDQPCKFGHRVEGHAVYCHNDEWDDSPRKCRRSWYTGGEVKDEDCPGFQPNPAFTGGFNPTTIAEPLCGQCGGTKLINSDRGKMETCPRCMGCGQEPQAITLSRFAQDTLELGVGMTGRHPGQNEFYIRVAASKEESDSVHSLCDMDLVRLRSMTFAGDYIVYLLQLTMKGDAVVRANWEAAKASR